MSLHQHAGSESPTALAADENAGRSPPQQASRSASPLRIVDEHATFLPVQHGTSPPPQHGISPPQHGISPPQHAGPSIVPFLPDDFTSDPFFTQFSSAQAPLNTGFGDLVDFDFNGAAEKLTNFIADPTWNPEFLGSADQNGAGFFENDPTIAAFDFGNDGVGAALLAPLDGVQGLVQGQHDADVDFNFFLQDQNETPYTGNDALFDPALVNASVGFQEQQNASNDIDLSAFLAEPLENVLKTPVIAQEQQSIDDVGWSALLQDLDNSPSIVNNINADVFDPALTVPSDDITQHNDNDNDNGNNDNNAAAAQVQAQVPANTNSQLNPHLLAAATIANQAAVDDEQRLRMLQQNLSEDAVLELLNMYGSTANTPARSSQATISADPSPVVGVNGGTGSGLGPVAGSAARAREASGSGSRAGHTYGSTAPAGPADVCGSGPAPASLAGHASGSGLGSGSASRAGHATGSGSRAGHASGSGSRAGHAPGSRAGRVSASRAGYASGSRGGHASGSRGGRASASGLGSGSASRAGHASDSGSRAGHASAPSSRGGSVSGSRVRKASGPRRRAAPASAPTSAPAPAPAPVSAYAPASAPAPTLGAYTLPPTASSSQVPLTEANYQPLIDPEFPPFDPTARRPIYPAYAARFHTSQEARNYRRRVRVGPKDQATDIERVRRYGRQFWVRAMYEAMIDISDVSDGKSSIHRTRFTQAKGFDAGDLEAVAHHLFDNALAVHLRGWNRPQTYHKKVVRGKLLDLSERSIETRLARITMCLRHRKATVDDAMRGGVTLSLLVDNPEARGFTKSSNNAGNQKRGERLKAAPTVPTSKTVQKQPQQQQQQEQQYEEEQQEEFQEAFQEEQQEEFEEQQQEEFDEQQQEEFEEQQQEAFEEQQHREFEEQQEEFEEQQEESEEEYEEEDRDE